MDSTQQASGGTVCLASQGGRPAFAGQRGLESYECECCHETAERDGGQDGWMDMNTVGLSSASACMRACSARSAITMRANGLEAGGGGRREGCFLVHMYEDADQIHIYLHHTLEFPLKFVLISQDAVGPILKLALAGRYYVGRQWEEELLLARGRVAGHHLLPPHLSLSELIS